MAVPAQYKESQGWVPARPSDASDRGTWWRIFNDPILDQIVSKVAVSNQNVAASASAYAQARAIVGQQRATLFPAITVDADVARSGGGARAVNTAAPSTSTTPRSANNLQLGLGGSWEPDLWGRIAAGVNNAQANASSSEADLASATLSAQGECLTNYLSLRLADREIALLRQAITGYERVLQITKNRYEAGIAPKTDVLQAETQLSNAQADLSAIALQRAQFEHAIAVLIGLAPADFRIESMPDWNATIPEIPAGVPSTLLERRPDIAAAERRVAAANQSIGIARAAYFPNISLSASYGSNGSAVADLFSASTSLWSLGLSAAATIFNAGATRSRVEQAQGLYEESVARYRQTVLTAFQQVEDHIAASNVLAAQYSFRERASNAAVEAENQMLNRYKAGQVGYSEVVTSQVSALNARRALLQTVANRQAASVSLIQALGGLW
jgi:NodT family efflux transporter outer membrane factor (OMF) lipoprotein